MNLDEFKKIKKREEIEQVATKLGIEFDKKIGFQNLRRLVLECLGEVKVEGSTEQRIATEQPTEKQPSEITKSNRDEAKPELPRAEKEKEEEKEYKVMGLVNLMCLDGSDLVKNKISIIHTKREYLRLKADGRELFKEI